MSSRSVRSTAGFAIPLTLFLLFALALLAPPAARCADAAEITLDTLLPEMTSLAGMSEFPSPGYITKQFSSYDRGSKTPGNEAWFANGDANQFLRTETRDGRKEWVMMDAAGPGAIVRIWSANPSGTLRIYLDGSEKPALEALMPDLLSGAVPGIPKPLSHTADRGWNLYLPIPYAKSCKVTVDASKMYYHINYRTYAQATPVRTFSMDQLAQYQRGIRETAARLAEAQAPKSIVDQALSREAAELGLETPLVWRQSGAGAIDALAVKVASADITAALRGTVIRMVFDDETTVETPLGDFFGTAPGANPYESLPLGITKDGVLWSRWHMPYRKSARIEFIRRTGPDATIRYAVSTVPHTWTDRSMLFHAKWRSQLDVATRPMSDWNFLTAKGQGVFAGAAMHIDNPVRDWWGEGDEKIFVDGETFPSHFGTGTEDYFGYAWSSPKLFTHAYHNQTRCDGPGTYGHVSNNRWHFLDRIPFQSDFKFDMEVWHWRECKVNLAVTAYWYARPGASDGFAPIPAERLTVYTVPPFVAPRVAGALEGEEMRVIAHTAIADPQSVGRISGDSHLWWHHAPKPGDRLALGFKVEKAGRYRVFARFLKANDFGVHQIAINGVNAGAPMDFYAEKVTPQDEVDLGVHDLKAGENEISATVTGANEKAIKGYMLGLDYVRLAQP